MGSDGANARPVGALRAPERHSEVGHAHRGPPQLRANPPRLASLAECTWPDAYYVVGDGPYALLARCDLFTVTLYETVAEARRRRKHLDLRGCGKKCTRDHALFSLAGDERDASSHLLKDPQETAVDWLRTS